MYTGCILNGAKRYAMAKLTVEFNDKMSQILDKLAQEKGTSKVEVLRRAVALYKYLDSEANQQDKKVSITKGDRVVKDIVLP
jgi:predicted transcriptional regulator